MKTVTLSKPGISELNHFAAVIAEIERLNAQQVKIYHTFVSMGGKEFTLLTTSKDIHLGLGLMTLEGQYHFAELLFEISKFGEHANEMVVIDPYSKKAMLATLQYEHTGGKGGVIHLSPAH